MEHSYVIVAEGTVVLVQIKTKAETFQPFYFLRLKLFSYSEQKTYKIMEVSTNLLLGF